ncbi:helix-turn-helix transcriptional regulator [Paraburkholderia sp. A1BS-2L]|uniref:helix-turn-helix domain-containing protein n=1 Tax=Paraburkholderia sp. A1BS-2L TaxID=3028373 RepID=UPI003DA8E15B
MGTDKNKSDQPLRERLAGNLRRIRLQKNFSQEALAEKCGFHRTYISQVERGATNITIDNLQKIAAVLEIDAKDLLSNGPSN